MAMPTMQERREMHTRIEGATPGPWTLHHPGSGYETIEAPSESEYPRTVLAKEKVHGHSEDYRFIAHARSDLPRCLEALDQAEVLLRDAAQQVGENLAERIRVFLEGDR